MISTQFAVYLLVWSTIETLGKCQACRFVSHAIAHGSRYAKSFGIQILRSMLLQLHEILPAWMAKPLFLIDFFAEYGGNPGYPPPSYPSGLDLPPARQKHHSRRDQCHIDESNEDLFRQAVHNSLPGE